MHIVSQMLFMHWSWLLSHFSVFRHRCVHDQRSADELSSVCWCQTQGAAAQAPRHLLWQVCDVTSNHCCLQGCNGTCIRTSHSLWHACVLNECSVLTTAQRNGTIQSYITILWCERIWKVMKDSQLLLGSHRIQVVIISLQFKAVCSPVGCMCSESKWVSVKTKPL